MANDLLILTAPPAAGKTYWIQSLIAELGESDLLIISPLRALADECKSKWPKGTLVMTPEEWTGKKICPKFVIFDEFHLHFHWGDTFRPVLWEVFYELSASASLTVLLTATLNDKILDELKAFRVNFDQMIWFDVGNMRLKNKPGLYVKAPSRSWVEDLILSHSHEGVGLIFCPYREDVRIWEKKLTSLGKRVWTCVGGEAGNFSKRTTVNTNPPDFIVATTVLSHGVNLPQISRIYFLYAVQDQDFWIQMVARGGRKGEAFEVIALEEPVGLEWNKWKNLLAILRLGPKIKWHKIKGQLSQCFLKD